MSEGFDPDVMLFIDKINDPVRTDPQGKFSFQITEELFPDKRI